MPFDVNRFLREEFRPRTKAVPVPDLAPWFDGPAVWTVRNLSGTELALVNDAEKTSRNLEGLVAALAGAVSEDKAGELRQLLGLGGTPSDPAPGELARRLEMLRLASVDPPCDRGLALKLAEHKPTELWLLTNQITVLTGQGSEPGKANGSGGTPPSEPPSPSGIGGAAPSSSSAPTSSPSAA